MLLHCSDNVVYMHHSLCIRVASAAETKKRMQQSEWVAVRLLHGCTLDLHLRHPSPPLKSLSSCFHPCAKAPDLPPSHPLSSETACFSCHTASATVGRPRYKRAEDAHKRVADIKKKKTLTLRLKGTLVFMQMGAVRASAAPRRAVRMFMFVCPSNILRGAVKGR